MMIHRLSVGMLVTAAFLAAAVAPSAAQTEPFSLPGTSCSVDADATECNFVCLPSQYVAVELDGKGTITGECDFAAATCESLAGLRCYGDSLPTTTLLGGLGTCTLSDSDSASEGSCSARDPPPPPPCSVAFTVDVAGETIYVTYGGRVWLESNGDDGLQCGGNDPDTDLLAVIIDSVVAEIEIG